MNRWTLLDKARLAWLKQAWKPFVLITLLLLGTFLWMIMAGVYVLAPFVPVLRRYQLPEWATLLILLAALPLGYLLWRAPNTLHALLAPLRPLDRLVRQRSAELREDPPPQRYRQRRRQSKKRRTP